MNGKVSQSVFVTVLVECEKSYILGKDENYNADKVMALRAMPAITIGLKEIFDY